MTKIDIDKFVASLIEFSPQQSMKYIKALTDQGLKYKDGEIVNIDSDFITITIPKDLKGTDTDGGVVGEKGEQGEQPELKMPKTSKGNYGSDFDVDKYRSLTQQLDYIMESLRNLRYQMYIWELIDTKK